MIGKSPNQAQKHLFLPNLTEYINSEHALYKLAEQIDWSSLEQEFEPFYSNLGQPAKPIRLMAGLLILKKLHNLSDEKVIAEWVSNPYFQFFCGEAIFQWLIPCDPTDLAHFRNRIGQKGIKRIIGASSVQTSPCLKNG